MQQLRKQYSGVNLKIIDRVIVEAKNFTSPPATSGDNFDLSCAAMKKATGKGCWVDADSGNLLVIHK